MTEFAIQLSLFELIVFIFSVMIHEITHGFVAERLGDPTARLAGRLTLNPIKHIDPIGSVILPLLLMVTHSPFVFGWAKPVPYDPRNLKNPRLGGGLIAAAGPLVNLTLAAIFGLFLRFLPVSGQMVPFLALIVYVNILLAIFNLIPIPPLDGSKVLWAVLPPSLAVDRFLMVLEQYGFILLLLLLVSGGLSFIVPIISSLFRLFTGVSF